MLLSPQLVKGLGIQQSRSARLPVGEVHIGDLCLSTARMVLRVVRFVEGTGAVLVLAMQLVVGPTPQIWRDEGSFPVCVSPEEVGDLLTWAPKAPGEVRACLPFV